MPPPIDAEIMTMPGCAPKTMWVLEYKAEIQ
jgi:hypothetical protein